MRIVSVYRVVTEWIDEIAELHCITDLPKSVRSGMWHAGMGCMAKYGPKAARRAMWNRCAQYAERDARITWFDVVKSPIPAFLQPKP